MVNTFPSTTIADSPFIAEYVSSSPSTSVADKFNVINESSSIVWLTRGLIIGVSLTDSIVTVKLVLTIKRDTLSLAETITSPDPNAFSENVNVSIDSSISAISSSIVSDTNMLKFEPFSTSLNTSLISIW